MGFAPLFSSGSSAGKNPDANRSLLVWSHLISEMELGGRRWGVPTLNLSCVGVVPAIVSSRVYSQPAAS